VQVGVNDEVGHPEETLLLINHSISTSHGIEELTFVNINRMIMISPIHTHHHGMVFDAMYVLVCFSKVYINRVSMVRMDRVGVEDCRGGWRICRILCIKVAFQPVLSESR